MTADTCRVLSRDINGIKFDLDGADSSILEMADICYNAILLASYSNLLQFDLVHIRGRLPLFIANYPQSKLPCVTLQLEGRVENGVEITIWEEAGPVFYKYFEFAELSIVTVKQGDLVTLVQHLVALLNEQAVDNAQYLANVAQILGSESLASDFSGLKELQSIKIDRNDAKYLAGIINVLKNPSIKQLVLTKLDNFPEIVAEELLQKQMVKICSIEAVGESTGNSWVKFEMRKADIYKPTITNNPIISLVVAFPNYPIPSNNNLTLPTGTIGGQPNAHVLIEYNKVQNGAEYNSNMNRVVLDWYIKAINNNNISRIEIICRTGRIIEDDVFDAVINNIKWFTVIHIGYAQIVSFRSVDGFNEYIKSTANIAATSTYKKPFEEPRDSRNRRFANRQSAVERIIRSNQSQDKKARSRRTGGSQSQESQPRSSRSKDKRAQGRRSQNKLPQDNSGAASSAA